MNHLACFQQFSCSQTSWFDSIVRQTPRWLGAWACWLLFVLHGTDVSAQADEIPAAVETLMTDVALELEQLQRQIDELKAAGAYTAPVSTTATNSFFTLGGDSPDKPSYPNARLTGFFQADAVWFHQDAANRLAVGNGVAADGDVQDGADFRRTRLAAVGKVWDNVGYMIEMDFSFPGRPSFMDVWLDIDDVMGNSNLRIGQFRHPFGMDGLSSVKELTFLERALPFAFLPFRQIGAMSYGQSEDEMMTWAVSGFRFPTDTFGGNVGDDGGYGMATHVTRLLLDNGPGNGLVHIGGGYSFIDPANDFVRYLNQPEVFVGETGGGLVAVGVPANVPPFVDTGMIPTDNVNLFNAEVGAAMGSFYAQSEVIFSVVQQQGGPTLTFPGAYAHAGYFLTGETRDYNRKNGIFGRVKPICPVGKEGGRGAWEVAARWSFIDLNDANIQGGRLNDITGGLNWYLNQYTKFQLNYIHAFLDSPINGNSEADIFAARAQIDF